MTGRRAACRSYWMSGFHSPKAAACDCARPFCVTARPVRGFPGTKLRLTRQFIEGK
ncbi:hypothetical protein SPHINGOT1_70003 [Sphingomonas sp. T1]|nr:hypothetical protein SPHINGOT1_70003 [Sphingomonas sp. T1]